MNNKKVISLLTLFTIIFTVIGGSLAYWNWNTTAEQQTNVVFTIEKDFSCAVDGGGNITSSDVKLAPTTCTDTARAIKREIKVTPTIKKDNLTINMDLWLDVNSIGTGLSESVNFNYVLTTSSTSCEEGTILSSGTFNGTTAGSRVDIMNKKAYTETTTDTYYLYIWLDTAETSNATMNQAFNLSLNGSCTDYQFEPEKPDLDDGMIPVTISANGVVTTIDEDDDSWYNYDEKEWANVVLVSDSSRSNYSNTTGVTVNQDDILAYYVWIPRYKYKIPQTRCSSLDNPTEESNPECYAPYTVSDEDKTKLLNFVADNEYCSTFDDLTSEEQVDVLAITESTLNTGWYDDYYSINDVIYDYSIGNSWSMCETFVTDGTITINDNYNGNNLLSPKTAVAINIEFEATNESMSTGNAKTSYRTHPAFWWDNDSDGIVDAGETVAGIWVGKFETSTNTGSTCYTSSSYSDCSPANVSPRIVPNVKSLRYQNIREQFATSQKFTADGNIYGLSSTSTNAHMMKNSEWGAVAYLSHSKYGINQEIYINNSRTYITGRSGGNVGGSAKKLSEQFSGETSTNRYNNYGYYTWLGENVDASGNIGSYASDRTIGTYASTTGNVTGVYDMSGGAWENVMANYNNKIGVSSFGSLPNKKYYDLYTTEDSLTACNGGICYGHALSETTRWYNDTKSFVFGEYSWLARGAHFNSNGSAGSFAVTFRSSTNPSGSGSRIEDISWRSVVVVGFGT